MQRIKTSQIRDFYSIVNAFADNGVIVRFSPDMSKIHVCCAPFKFVVDFPFKYFDYDVVNDYIKSKLDVLKSGVSIETLMSEFYGVVHDLNYKKNGS